MNAVIVLLIMGLVLGLIIGVVVKFIAVAADPKQQEVEALLPGANCGACGHAGCSAFAEALLHGDAEPSECPVNDSDAVQRICGLLGMEYGQREPKIAVVKCGGDSTKAENAGLYNGVIDCKDADLVASGGKACRYGCLGLGSCARVCPFGAIEITDSGIAVVHPDICTGCGKCVPVCPRNIIELVPKSAPLHVLCNSPEKGNVKRKACSVSCIACRKCVKAAEEEGVGEMIIDGFLARVNYDNPPTAATADVCPTGCIHTAPVPASLKENAQAEEVQEVANG